MLDMSDPLGLIVVAFTDVEHKLDAAKHEFDVLAASGQGSFGSVVDYYDDAFPDPLIRSWPTPTETVGTSSEGPASGKVLIDSWINLGEDEPSLACLTIDEMLSLVCPTMPSSPVAPHCALYWCNRALQDFLPSRVMGFWMLWCSGSVRQHLRKTLTLCCLLLIDSVMTVPVSARFSLRFMDRFRGG